VLHFSQSCWSDRLNEVSEQKYSVHNCSARIHVLQLAYTSYEDMGCKPTCKKPSTAGLCTGKDKVGNVRLLIFGGPWRYMLICLKTWSASEMLQEKRVVFWNKTLKLQNLELDRNAPNHDSALWLVLPREYHDLATCFG